MCTHKTVIKDQSFLSNHSNHNKLNIKSSKKDDDNLLIRCLVLCIFDQPSTRMGFRWMITFAVNVWKSQSPGLWLLWLTDVCDLAFALKILNSN